MVADIFFASFLDCLIFLNSPLSSFNLFHISPSLILSSSDFILRFFFFQVLCFFASFSESLFCSLFNFLLLAIANFIKVFYWFLFKFTRFFALFLLVIYWIFRNCLFLHQHLIAVRFEQDMKIALQIKPLLLGCGVDFWKYVRIYVLKISLYRAKCS